MISFAIPTRNRAEKLHRCVQSLVAQQPAEIFIADNASEDGTAEVCEKLAIAYPCVRYARYEEYVPFAESYRRAVLGVRGEYVWTFGDDDLLVETSLAFVKAALVNTGVEYLHVGEATRVERSDAASASTFKLCNAVGLVDATGFISGNVMRVAPMRAVMQSPSWAIHATSAYPQSTAILEAFADAPMMLAEVGCVTGGTPDDAVGQLWLKEDTCWKYLYIADALRYLVEQGRIPAKVNETFFRYLQGSLMDRLMHQFNDRTVFSPGQITAADWDAFEFLAGMVEGARGQQLLEWVQRVRGVSTEERAVFLEFYRAWMRLRGACDGVEFPIYPFSYLPREGNCGLEC